MKKLTLISSLIFVTSCAAPTPYTNSMQEEECQELDWQALGQVEGSKGLSQEMLDYHIKRCPPEIESAARSLYLKGYQEGIPNYCNYRTGFIKGEIGDPVPSMCEDQIYTEFRKGYREGVKAGHK